MEEKREDKQEKTSAYRQSFHNRFQSGFQNKREEKNPYADLMNLPHHVSSSRPKMPVSDRAAQFAPFAALTGHGAAIRETARLTEDRVELDENSRALLDRRLQLIREKIQIQEHPLITVTYFQPDALKEGGTYEMTTGSVKKIDEYAHAIVMMEGCRIPIGEIVAMDGELFRMGEMV